MTPRSSFSSGWFRLIRSAARRAMLKLEVRLRSTTRRNSSSGCGPCLVSVRLAIPPPAVLHRKWSAPSSSQAAASAASVPSKSVTSQAWKLPPSDLATSAPFERGRSRIETCAPSRTSISAVAFAMPEAPPTTTAALPEIFMVSRLSLLLVGALPEADRQSVESADDEGLRVGELAGIHQPEVAQPREQPLEADARLGARQAGAGTEVLPVAEGDVAAG